MLVVGLTGGIASGKTTVSAIFADAGATIIDADRLSRQAVEKGRPAYQRIVRQFGKQVLRPDGELDRKMLGHIIFRNPTQKKLLNSIVHPPVRRATDRQLAQIAARNPNALVVLDVPLLFETRMHADLDEVIVVYVPEQIQLQRLMARDHIPRVEAQARIRSQMPLEEKKALATIVIDNSGSRADTRRQALAIYANLKKKLCGGRPARKKIES